MFTSNRTQRLSIAIRLTLIAAVCVFAGCGDSSKEKKRSASNSEASDSNAQASLSAEAIKAVDDLVAGKSPRSYDDFKTAKDEAALVQKYGAESIAVPRLIEIVEGNNRDARRAAIVRLGHLESHAHLAVPLLMNDLKVNDWEAGWTATTALCRMGPLSKEDSIAVAKYWLSIIDHVMDGSVGFGESPDIALLGPDALAPLLAALNTASLNDVSKILKAIARFGPEGVEGIPALLKILGDENDPTRHLAAHALASIGPEALPALASAISNKRVPNAAEGAIMSAFASQDLDPTNPAFATILESEKKRRHDLWDGRLSVLRGRVALHDPTNQAAITFFNDLYRRSSRDRPPLPDIMALYKAGQAAGIDLKRPFIKILDGPEQDKLNDASTLIAVARILWQVDPSLADKIVDSLGILTREPINTSEEMADLLGEIGANEKGITALIGGFEARRTMARTGASRALIKIGTPAVPKLTEALRHNRPGVRYQAAQTLGKIGPAAKSAAPALRELVNDPWKPLADAAAEALKSVEVAGS